MPRVTCLSLPRPRAKYRLHSTRNREKFGLGFETYRSARNEDGFRAKSLRAARKLLSKSEAKRAKKLAKKLAAKNDPTSVASSRYMREWRIRICGNLWRLMDKNVRLKPCFFTIIPATWEVDAGELHQFSSRVMLGRLRTALYESGAGQAQGFMFGALHGEYHPESRVFQLHFHGVAGGQMVDVIDKLRKKAAFKSVRATDGKERVWQRVQIDRWPLTSLPRVASYVLKSYWPSQSRFEREDGSSVARGSKKRILEPHHSEVLLWLDKLTLPDLVLSIGVSPSTKGLKISQRRLK